MLTLVLPLSVLVLGVLALLLTPMLRLKPEPETESEFEPELKSEFALALLPGVLDVALLTRDAVCRSPPSADRRSGHSRRRCRSVCLVSSMIIDRGGSRVCVFHYALLVRAECVRVRTRGGASMHAQGAMT